MTADYAQNNHLRGAQVVSLHVCLSTSVTAVPLCLLAVLPPKYLSIVYSYPHAYFECLKSWSSDSSATLPSRLLAPRGYSAPGGSWSGRIVISYSAQRKAYGASLPSSDADWKCSVAPTENNFALQSLMKISKTMRIE